MKVKKLFEDDFENELADSRHKDHEHEKIAGKEPEEKDIAGRIAYHEKLKSYHFDHLGDKNSSAYHQNQYRRQKFIINKLKEKRS